MVYQNRELPCIPDRESDTEWKANILPIFALSGDQGTGRAGSGQWRHLSGGNTNLRPIIRKENGNLPGPWKYSIR